MIVPVNAITALRAVSPVEPIEGPGGDVPSPGGSAPPALRDIDDE